MAPRLRAGIMLPDCHVTNCHNLFFKIRLQASEEERETPRVRGSERLELNCQRWKYACLVTSVETAYSSDGFADKAEDEYKVLYSAHPLPN